jgi:carboxypeptidase family protein
MSFRKISTCFYILLLATFIAFDPGFVSAQTGGEAAISGVITDSTGSLLANATVIARNNATGVETSRVTTSAGVYQISPLIVGTYTITVSAKGFQTFQQENVALNQNQIFGFNASLKVGNQNETITVSSAPPQLDTANAVLGGTISSTEFIELPLLVANNQQRDITSFSNLLPGAQPGARSSLFSGTASRVEEVYLDGIPLTTISQIGDNRPIFNLVPAEAIGQIGALTSGQSVEYQGAGSVNYSMKSGTNQFHGSVADFVRNTIFDTWGFTAIAATQKKIVNGVPTTVPVGKPIDHQNELSATIGGPISIPHLFNGHDKLFFYAGYDRLHSRTAPAYGTATIPTLLMRTGDFTELLNSTQSAGTGAAGQTGPGYLIYAPTSQACVGSSCTRQAYSGLKNGLATPNIVPQSVISPIAQKMQSYLPTPTTSALTNNYLGGIPGGYDNWLYSGRIDYTISPKQTLSFVLTGGNRTVYPETLISSGSAVNIYTPIPYTSADYSIVAGHWADMEDTYTINPHMVNQFKFGFSNFGGPPLRNLTQGTQYAATNMGITFSGIPSNSQASTEFPTQIFGGSNIANSWGGGASGSTATTVTETYTLVDNFLWIKGKHAMTFGGQFQWLEDNSSANDGPTSSLTMNYSVNDTAQESGSAYVANTGYSYASYLLGAVNSTGITLQPFSVLGGRYRPFAPYFEDDYKVTSKLTLNLGLRWDYIPVYQEVLNRYSFLNPTLTNPVTGNLGALQFAGNNGGSGVSCGCSSPASNYMKNWGPRVGFAYSVNEKTVFRGAFATVYSHGGGTGGAGNAYQGPSQLGFTSSPSFNPGTAGTGAGPAFYLNNSAGFTALGNMPNGQPWANANFGGPGYSVPAITPPGAVSQTLNVGNTVSSIGGFIAAGGAPGFEDPYISARAPEFNFWNFGIQRELTKDLTIMANYAGSESHFLAGAGNMRGLYSGQINPSYYHLGTLLNSPGTTTNLAAAGIATPYASYVTAAGTASGAGQATVGHATVWMPQFSSTTDTWGSQSANAMYHALQISLAKRLSHGLTFNVNYTYSKNVDDAGTQRSGFAIPGSVLRTGKSWAQNRIDRSWSTNSLPQNLAIFGVYQLPFGKGGFGADNRAVRILAGGWQFSSVFTYSSGLPLALTSSSCSSTFQPGAGTCMPDLNPSFVGSGNNIRQNGSWGKGMTATTLGTTRYINGYISSTSYLANGQGADSNGAACGTTSSSPFCNSNQFMLGDAPRTAVYGLRAPSVYNLNASIRRTFNLTPERFKFIFAVDCQNVTNKVTFSGIGVGVNTSSFGTVSSATSNTGSRDFQFSGRISF